MKRRTISIVCYFFILIGLVLTAINIYGLGKEIRPPGLFETKLRFRNDITLNYEESKKAIRRNKNETEYDYAKRLTDIIANSIAHIHWADEMDGTRFHQLIPIWENYFLYFMGLFSGIPEYEKYHYADYKRSLKRGIGICGDASMIMSQLLNKEGIKNQIVSFPGHVVIAAQHRNGKEVMYDPDFGVMVPHSIKEIQKTPRLATPYYSQQGFPKDDIVFFRQEYAKNFTRWDGVSHFITKKYYFEKAAYFLKWPFPFLLFMVSYLVLRKNKKTNFLQQNNINTP